ncbi:protein LURP-one-related 17 [Sesamum alatum]|uniref:Protein LURP-one-related 17 n=1 Tax=Sesamum alatum TaxID=300844 RepID=A0AAE1Y3J8_9LAMI|nr:protein LURP-one-related 17 [Sesamum alatum]
MLLFLKSTSRTVHHCHEEEGVLQYKNYSSDDHEEASCVSLTVWTKSLVFSCKGFTVIGPQGNLVYRVDNYTGRPDQTLLMDGSGNPIFTICRRKKLRLVVDNYWQVYEGEMGNNDIDSSSKKPVFCVRKNTSIVMRTKPSVLAYVSGGILSEKGHTYTVEGSYVHRSCKILDETRRVVSEIKKKEALPGGVSFGLEVFDLVVKPGIESRFAMAVVILLDQMFS